MKDFKNSIAEMAETFILSFVLIMILYGVIASIEIVSGESMEPNFHTNERILVDKISPILDNYRRGDVVVLIPPTDKGSHYIKRVIGLPGETIKIFDCKVYVLIDGSKFVLKEEYLYENICTYGATVVQDGRSYVIPKDQYMVLGDNREHSIDSRYLGFVDRKAILGRVAFILWPIAKIGFVN